jgi:hypothetical protein
VEVFVPARTLKVVKLFNVLPNNNATKNIVVQLKDGIIQLNVDEASRARIQRIEMQHAVDILGELLSDTTVSPYSSNGERAVDKMFDTRLLSKIEPGACLEPRQPPPRMWNFAEKSGKSNKCKCKSPETHLRVNNLKRDQQSILMMLPTDCLNLIGVTMTLSLDSIGHPHSTLKTRLKTNL